MGDDIKAIYRSAWGFALAVPLLFLLPAVPEFTQHVVEAKLGMYRSIADARGMAHDAGRLGWGYLKTLALLLPGYWMVRYVGFGGDARRARAIAWPAFGLWLVLFVAMGALQAWQLFGTPIGAVLGLSGRAAAIASATATIAGSILGVYLIAWQAAWPLGRVDCGPVTSCRIMAGSFWRSVTLMIAGIVPLMALHYALGLGAIGRPEWLVWPMLVADALVVALLAHCVAAVTAVAAGRAAARSGYRLVPAATGLATA